MFNPNDQPARIEAYLGRHLGRTVRLCAAEQLTQSTRQAPWRLDVEINGAAHAYVLQLDPTAMAHEYRVLRQMATLRIPTPQAYGLDPAGEALGVAAFFSDFIEGESLLGPMLAGETWAETLYIETVCRLQAVTEDDLGGLAQELKREPAESFLAEARARLDAATLDAPDADLIDAAYARLRVSLPVLPPVRFGNGDLWLDNFLVRGRQLAGIIDFANAGFSDPVYEFLLSFFVSPALQGRGTEARFCRRIGVDPALLNWYHGLEIFDTLGWVLPSGEPFVHHTRESLMRDLARWLGTT